VAKINISIPDELLADVDALASELARSRSGLVAEATAHYVASIHEDRAEAERRARIDRAMGDARKVAARFGAFDGTSVVREDRNGDHRTGGR
jgi:metal-responsive CopG/Arc/MetJ family transcriptional regulator